MLHVRGGRVGGHWSGVCNRVPLVGESSEH